MAGDDRHCAANRDERTARSDGLSRFLNFKFKIARIDRGFRDPASQETAVSSAFLFKLNLCAQRSHDFGAPGLEPTVMSASALITDSERTSLHVGFVPQPDSCTAANGGCSITSSDHVEICVPLTIWRQTIRRFETNSRHPRCSLANCGSAQTLRGNLLVGWASGGTSLRSSAV
jgi:hypothetical protein